MMVDDKSGEDEKGGWELARKALQNFLDDTKGTKRHAKPF